MATTAPEVRFALPTVLEAVVGRRRFPVRGRTVGEALEAAFERYPNLRHHLCLESGEMRPHVLCVLNGDCLDRSEVLETGLNSGDEILIHQAISGGC